jgi:hypothetical protein
VGPQKTEQTNPTAANHREDKGLHREGENCRYPNTGQQASTTK